MEQIAERLNVWLNHSLLAPPALLWASAAFLLLGFSWWERRWRDQALQQWGISNAAVPRQQVPAVAWMVILLLAITAAQPWRGREPLRREMDDRRVLILLDLSRSMLAEDGLGKSRLARAQRALLDWLNEIETRRARPQVGLIVFAGNARLLLPPADDFGPLRQRLHQVAEGMFGRSWRLTAAKAGPDSKVGTSFGPAFRLARQCLAAAANQPLRPVVLLVTDGDDLAGDGPAQARAELAGWSDLVVLGVGRPDIASPIPTGDADVPFLQYAAPGQPPQRVETRRRDDVLAALASAAGGVWFDAEKGAPLLSWWREWLAAPTHRIWQEARQTPKHAHAWFLVPAWVLLFLEFRQVYSPSSPTRQRRRIVPGVLTLLGLGLLCLSGLAASPVAPAGMTEDADGTTSDLAAKAWQRGDWVAALAAWQVEQITTTDPGRLAYNQACAWLQLGRWGEAIAGYRQCLEGAVGLRRFAGLMGLGNAYAQSGAVTPGSAGLRHLRAALLSYEAALQEWPFSLTEDASLRLWRDAVRKNRLLVEQALYARLEEVRGEPELPPERPPSPPGSVGSDAVPSSEASALPGPEVESETQRRPGRGNLAVLLDEDDPAPVPPAQARILLENHLQRLYRLRRVSTSPPTVTDRDW